MSFSKGYWVRLEEDANGYQAASTVLARYSDANRAFHLVDAKVVVKSAAFQNNSIAGVLAIKEGTTEVATLPITHGTAVGAALHMTWATGYSTENKFDAGNKLVVDVKTKPVHTTSSSTKATCDIWIKIWED